MSPDCPVETVGTGQTAAAAAAHGHIFTQGFGGDPGLGERDDGVDVRQERLMSSDQGGEPPLPQEEADPGPSTGGKDEAALGTEEGSGGMVS